MTRRRRPRLRPGSFMALVLALVIASAPPASAQAPPGPTTTTAPRPTTTAPTTTTTTPSPSTSTSTPAPTSTTLSPPPTLPPPNPTDHVEEDGSEPPPPPRPVPPRATPRVLTPADSAIARVVTAQQRSSQGAVDAAVAEARAADRALADLEARQAAMQRTYETLHADDAKAAERLQQQRDAMRIRAIALYLSGGTDPVIPVGASVYEYGRKRVLVEALHEADKRTIAAFRAAKEAAGDEVTRLVADLEVLNGQVISARANAEKASLGAQRALGSLEAVQASGKVAVDGFVFPVGDPHTFADSFGAPRMVGTPLFHLHQGNDIFAPYGTPLYACERGIVFKMGTDRLGGTKLWISGESGTTYYYAHMSAFAAGLADGQLVEAGTVVGYVGNSGNAASTPPHLHFEIHPGGGPAIDPYPTLKAVDDATKQYGPRVPVTAPAVTAPAPPGPDPKPGPGP